MEKISLNHWFVKENNLSVSTMNHHTTITICKNNKEIFFRVRILDSEREELVFNFYSLEEAIAFTEKTVAKCRNNDEIIEKYYEQYQKGRLKQKDLKVKDNKITLTEEEVDAEIANYFGEGKSYDVSAIHELSINNHTVDIHFYLVESFDLDGSHREFKTMLTEGDLKNVFESYVEQGNYDLEDFKYIGGVHKVGYFFEEDTPHYEGIELKVKPKEKVYKREKRESK